MALFFSEHNLLNHDLQNKVDNMISENLNERDNKFFHNVIYHKYMKQEDLSLYLKIQSLLENFAILICR